MKTRRPPRAAICPHCFEEQGKSGSAREEYYCAHNQVWAVRRADGGWVLSTGVTAAYHEAMLSDAHEKNAHSDRRRQPGGRMH